MFNVALAEAFRKAEAKPNFRRKEISLNETSARLLFRLCVSTTAAVPAVVRIQKKTRH